jgi:hypothetical protein
MLRALHPRILGMLRYLGSSSEKFQTSFMHLRIEHASWISLIVEETLAIRTTVFARSAFRVSRLSNTCAMIMLQTCRDKPPLRARQWQ